MEVEDLCEALREDDRRRANQAPQALQSTARNIFKSMLAIGERRRPATP
jgi:hypothetical protein